MNKLECVGCLNLQKEEDCSYITDSKENSVNGKNCKIEKQNGKVQQKLNPKVLKEDESNNQNQNSIFVECDCCESIYCLKCCLIHMEKYHLERQNNSPAQTGNSPEYVGIKNDDGKTAKPLSVHIICQQCQEESSIKYCENCEQYLCEKCSFKIHNKGKRAKHTLEQIRSNALFVKTIVLFTKDISSYLKDLSSTPSKKLDQLMMEFASEELKINDAFYVFLVEECLSSEIEKMEGEKFKILLYDPSHIKLSDLQAFRNRYPFLSVAKLIIISQTNDLKHLIEQVSREEDKSLTIDVCLQYTRKMQVRKLERVNSQKTSLNKHNKQFSNFSNVSAISKVENQSILSNEPSDLFESAEQNLTTSQNQSILMMGVLSDGDKQQKQDKKISIKQEKVNTLGHNRIYSIREENSHNSLTNLSSSTQNSTRKRNKKWPIPYFQPFRVSKNERGSKYDAQLYLRELAEKGILMIRREKAQEIIVDPQISRIFIRNIGQKQIEYVAYIIDFLSVQCLTWVIESIKQDKMTPNQKLIQSRLKQSFDLKVNMKLWDSIIKYLQSSQYQQDEFEQGKVRYIPKINVVKYGEQYLLQFQQRKWEYEDQQLLDEQEEEWQQFKQLIADYFNGKSQITGGRYGCVQYVKLNGPRPLRKCSLGKISMFVQEAINKGIIRYHKTLLVSNSENNVSMCSNPNAAIDNLQQLVQLQKDIKIMSIQTALIDMFLQVPPNTLISLAQIPLNLKKGIIFDYNLVQLGFPKLKNILNTLTDKLILQTTKTHITYEITTNGSQAIQRLRSKLLQLSQRLLSHVLSFINLICMHYQSIILEDLYNQLTLKLGFSFDYKMYKTPDFYQFILYYCTQVVNVQYISGMFIVYSKYTQQYPTYEAQQGQRNVYGQQAYHNYNTNYRQDMPEDYSKNSQKKEQFYNYGQPNGQTIGSDNYGFNNNIGSTPKFQSNSQVDKPKFSGLIWSNYQLQNKKQEKVVEDEQDMLDDENSKQMQQIINHLLDEEKPKTVIVNDAASECNNPNNEFYILPKQADMVDEIGFEMDDVAWSDKSGKGQHNRVKSTAQPIAKHWRGYSTIAK